MTIHKHYLQGLGFNQLGTLGRSAENTIEENTLVLSAMLEKQNEQKQYQQGDTLSFDDIDNLYNTGLTFEEKQAWVWFKRSQGVPMTGWDKYFFKKEKSDYTAKKDTVILVTNRATTIKDNHFRDIAEVPKGVQLGTLTRFFNNYDNKVYDIFTTPEGYKQRVNRADVDRLGEGEVSAGLDVDGQIKFLVNKNALFFSQGEYLPYAFFAFGNMYDREISLNKDKDFIVENFGQEVYDNHLKIVNNAKPKFLSVSVADPRDRPIILAISPLAKQKDMFGISEFNAECEFILSDFLRYSVKNWKPFSNKSNKEKDEKKESWSFWDKEQGEYKYKLPLRDAFRFWLYEQPKESFNEVSAYQIERFYLDRGSMDSKMSDEEKDTLKKYTPQLGEVLFAKFLNEALTFEDTQKLDRTFNVLYNGYADISYNKVPIGFECSAWFKTGLFSFTQAQREAIAFMEVASSGILAYDVGVGKTISAIITAQNAIQQGKCKRPIIIVPNQTYKKWKMDLFGGVSNDGDKSFGVLSGTDITLNDFGNLGVNKVKFSNDGRPKIGEMYLDKPLPEKSITLVTYEGFKTFGILGYEQSELFEEFYDILDQEDKANDSYREKAKSQQSLDDTLAKINGNAKINFPDLQIDYLIIDEAHSAKNVFQGVKADDEGKVRYDLGSGKPSAMGIKAFAFCNYIIRKYNGNVLLLTATPFTNSPVEIYSMLSLVGYLTMKSMRLNNLNTFMCTFVKQSLEYTNKVDGNIVMDYVVKAYTNRQILQKLIYSHIIYKTGEDAGVKRPVKINLPRLNKIDTDGRVVALTKSEQVLTYLAPNAIQVENQKVIEATLTALLDPETKVSGASLGDIGRFLNKNMDNALSPYLYDKESDPDPVSFVEDSPKIHYVMECIKSVKAWHEAKGEECSGQVIYCNRGKLFFPLMQRYLNSEIGFRTKIVVTDKDSPYFKSNLNEVEIIADKMDADRKELIKEAFLDGFVKVIIGTSSIREGIDLQTRGTCLYALTVDWNPTDMKQLEGRIHRQGNKFGYVRIVLPLVQDSMDIFMFQKLEEKTARVNDIWYKAGRGNVLDQEALDPEEIKLALFSKIDVLAKLRYDFVMKDLNRRYVVNNTSVEALEKYKARYDSYVATRDIVIKRLKEYNKTLHAKILPVSGSMAKRYFDSLDKKEQTGILKKGLALVNDLSSFFVGTEQNDKAILKLGKDINTLLVLMNYNQDWSLNNSISNLTTLVSFVRKTEREMLTPRGLSAGDSVRLIDELKEEQKMIKARHEYLQTPKGMAEIKQEVIEKKEKFAVRGMSAVERAVEFANLNYLLTYGANEKAHYHLPSPQEAEQHDQENDAEAKAKKRARRIRIATATAIALALAYNYTK
jgi:hypothetical protein